MALQHRSISRWREHRRGRVAADGARRGACRRRERREAPCRGRRGRAAAAARPCRARPGTSTRSAPPRAARDGATDVVFLGTGGSSLGGQTLAQLADYAVPGLGRFADGAPRAFPRQPRPSRPSAASSRALPLATSRFVAISKSGGTGETLMQAIAVLSALRQERAFAPATGELFLGLSEPRGGRHGTACATSSSPRASPFSTTTPASAGAIRS